MPVKHVTAIQYVVPPDECVSDDVGTMSILVLVMVISQALVCLAIGIVCALYFGKHYSSYILLPIGIFGLIFFVFNTVCLIRMPIKGFGKWIFNNEIWLGPSSFLLIVFSLASVIFRHIGW